MEHYKNFNGDSGVLAYHIGADFIEVRFRTGRSYLYTYASAGSSNIERMKALARGGSGLNRFINLYVKYKYAR